MQLTKVFLISLGFSLLILPLNSNAPTAANPLPQKAEILRTIETARQAWIAQDPDVIAQLFTPDGKLIVPGNVWQGREAIREAIAQFREDFTNVEIKIKRAIIEGDRAAIEWDYEDTEKATGKRNSAEDVIIVVFQDGRISYWREYFDTQTPQQSEKK